MQVKVCLKADFRQHIDFYDENGNLSEKAFEMIAEPNIMSKGFLQSLLAKVLQKSALRQSEKSDRQMFRRCFDQLYGDAVRMYVQPEKRGQPLFGRLHAREPRMVCQERSAMRLQRTVTGTQERENCRVLPFYVK